MYYRFNNHPIRLSYIIQTLVANKLLTFSLNILDLLKCAKRIRHTLNKLMKSSLIYNKLQHYLIEHACIYILLTLICVD